MQFVAKFLNGSEIRLSDADRIAGQVQDVRFNDLVAQLSDRSKHLVEGPGVTDKHVVVAPVCVVDHNEI